MPNPFDSRKAIFTSVAWLVLMILGMFVIKPQATYDQLCWVSFLSLGFIFGGNIADKLVAK
jgi:hypothetical protein